VASWTKETAVSAPVIADATGNRDEEWWRCGGGVTTEGGRRDARREGGSWLRGEERMAAP
jgi:hypothetical protein